MAYFQRHKNWSLIASADNSRPLATPHKCTKAPTGNHARYTWPTSVTQKSFSTILVNSRKKGFSLLTPKRSHPTLLEWTFPEYDILMMIALLEKRRQSLRREPGKS